MFRKSTGKCLPTTLAYDFDAKLGRVHFRKGDSAEMKDCVEAFQAIDTMVSRIQTYTGRLAGTLFEKGSRGWTARRPFEL